MTRDPTRRPSSNPQPLVIVLPSSSALGGQGYQRPPQLNGITTKHRTGCGSLYIILNKDEAGQAREVLCKLGKAGGCASALLETVGRLVSVALQHGVPLEVLAKQCAGVRCYQHQGLIQSCVSYVGDRLNEDLQQEEEGGEAAHDA